MKQHEVGRLNLKEHGKSENVTSHRGDVGLSMIDCCTCKITFLVAISAALNYEFTSQTCLVAHVSSCLFSGRNVS